MTPTKRSETLRLVRKSRVAHGIAPLADTKTIRLMMLDKIIPLLITAMTVD